MVPTFFSLLGGQPDLQPAPGPVRPPNRRFSNKESHFLTYTKVKKRCQNYIIHHDLYGFLESRLRDESWDCPRICHRFCHRFWVDFGVNFALHNPPPFTPPPPHPSLLSSFSCSAPFFPTPFPQFLYIFSANTQRASSGKKNPTNPSQNKNNRQLSDVASNCFNRSIHCCCCCCCCCSCSC